MYTYSLHKYIWITGSILLCAIGGYYMIQWLSPTESQRFYYQLQCSRLACSIYLGISVLFFFRNRNLLLNQRSYAMPVAILRIIFFGMFAIGGIAMAPGMIRQLIEMSAYVNAQNLPDAFSRFLWKHIPINSFLIRLAFISLIISAWFAFLGLKTRAAMAIFAFSSFYIFAIGNLTGKINHNHDLFWIPLVLIFSGCGDILSMDRLLEKRKAGNIYQENPYNSTYHQARVLLWVMLGICYFFPGFWKIWNCGLDWALTANVKYQMYEKWNSLSAFNPVFRIDRFPILYQAGGLFTLVFELSFLFLLPFKKGRNVLLVAGILFHLLTWGTLHIFFIFFLMLYISFIDFNTLAKKFTRPASLPNPAPSPVNRRGLMMVSILLFPGFILYGILRLDSWPYTCYPRFDSLSKPYKESILAEYCPPDTPCYELDKTPVKDKFSPERLSYLEDEILRDLPNKSVKMEQLKTLYVSCYAFPSEGIINFYRYTKPINPDSLIRFKRELIGNFTLNR